GHKKRSWIPELASALWAANSGTRGATATCPPPLLRRSPPPGRDLGRQVAARGEVAAIRYRGRRSALNHVLRRLRGESARRQHPLPRRFVPDWRAPSPARGREVSR